MRVQDDQDRAFDATFEPHPGGYLVFTKRGGALFSAEEREAYVAAHRKAKPTFWKTAGVTAAGGVVLALFEFVAINGVLAVMPNSPLRTNLVIAFVLVMAFGLVALLFACFLVPLLSLMRRLYRDADRRPLAAPPRARLSLKGRAPNLIAFLGIIGFCIALTSGWVTFTWPWILAGCALIGLVVFVTARPPLGRR
jgi:uncharacterized membrane protein YhaH (DUF805 family)